MNKIYIPRAHAKNLYEIDPVWFVSHGFKTIFIDLDNTLDSYRADVPTSKARDFVAKLLELDLEPIILSNNTKRRVSRYANELKVKYVNSVGKPFIHKLNKYIEKQGIDKSKSVLIGDQTGTDICFGNKAKIFTILTDKLVKEDQITTRFNRIFDNIRRKILKRDNLLVSWRDI